MKHVPALDGLRAIAAIVVIVHHTQGPELAKANLGGLGVWLFFVLSGFLITGILLDAREKAGLLANLGIFYARRSLRIFPLYYLVLLAVALTVPSIWAGLPWHAAYLSNLYFPLRHDWDTGSHLWSLAVEEQFYLVWPLLVLSLPRRALLPLFIASAAVGPICRYALRGNEFAAYMLLPCNLDCLCMGAVLAWVARHGDMRRFSLACLAGGAPLLAYSFTIYGRPEHGAVQAIGAALTFTWAVATCATKRIAPLEWPPVLYLGKISYGLYLWHGFVVDFVQSAEDRLDIWLRLPPEGPWRFTYALTASVALASLSWFAFERPILGFKRWFEYSRR
jgi:peptidoglycan/LPS O-acetylase OafA/YrhL